MARKDDDLTTDKDESPKDEVLEKAKKRFRAALEAWQKQAAREKDDLSFQAPEKQWDEGARRQRLGMSIDGVPTPARPVLSISKLDQPIQMVLNQERAAHLGVSIQPLSADAETKTAEILEGLYRRIERDSRAHLARSWAFNRAVKAGRGYYEVDTEYDEYSTEPDDQVIKIKRILHQESVYFDPSAQEPDFSDANFAFIASWVPVQDFEAEFPGAKIPETDDGFQEDDNQDPLWVKGDGEQRAVRVLKYYDRVKTYKRVDKGQRKREECKVTWHLMTGWEVLDKGPWNGKLIPIITVVGSELIPFDAERRWQGIIAPAKDAQRLYNYSASTAVELVALEPKAPYIGAEGQFEGHESEWQQANIRNWPYLEYKPTTFNGEPIPPPQRAQVDVGRLGPSMQLLQQADQFIQVTTATYDPSLGRTNNREKSGRAIMALQQQGDEGNSHYMHNLAEISMGYEAKVILDLIPAIYDRPGRLARTLNEEDETETVMLNSPYVKHPQTGRPVPAPGGQVPPGLPMMPPQQPQQGPPGMPMQPLPPAQPEVRHYDLKKGIYSVAVSIGKTRQSALQEGAEEIGQILQADPQLMPLIGPLYFKYRSFPGAKEIADLMAQVRDKTFPGLKTDKDGQPSVEQAQARIQALEQQLQMMGQQLQEAAKMIETDQAKQQAGLQKAAMDNQTKLQIAAADTQAKLATNDADNQTKLILALLERQHNALMEALARGHEADMKGADQRHEAGMAASGQQHDAAMNALGTAPLAAPEFTGSATQPLETPKEV